MSDPLVQVAAVQTGPVRGTPGEAVDAAFAMVADLEETPDLAVFPEMFSLPFWCVGRSDPHYLSWAEGLDGETLTHARQWARELGTHAVVPFFERGNLAGEYYNSAAVLGPDGELIPGMLASGEQVPVYRKNAISAYNWGGSVNDEKYYFRPGAGYPTFATAIGRLGVLICYDRWFPEGWRLLCLAGAEVVCVPNTSTGRASELFVPSIRTWAAQNVVFAVATNRVGEEMVGGTATCYYGLSCIASPRGELLAVAAGDSPAAAVATIDLEELRRARLDLTMYRDRRPELYRGLVEP